MKKYKGVLKSIFSWIMIISFGYLIYNNISDFQLLANTLKEANLVYIAWGSLLALGNLSITTMIFKSTYSIFANKQEHLGKILPEMIAFSFVTISNPLGFTVASAYIARRLVRKGLSLVQSIFSVFSIQLGLNLAFLPLLAATLLILSNQHQLKQYEIIASGTLIGLSVLMVLVMIFIIVLPHFSFGAAKTMARLVNSISKPILNTEVFDTKKIDDVIATVQDISGAFDHSLKKYATTILFAAIYHTFNLIILFLAFYSFNIMLPFTSLVTLYGVIVLFSIVSPTPQGIGIVEGLAQFTAIGIGLLPEVSIIPILTYRVMVLWFPALLGMIIYRFTKEPILQPLTDSN